MKRIHRNGHWNLGGIAIINILTIVKFMLALRVVGQGLYSWYAWSQLSKLKIWDRWFIGMLLILGTRKRQCWDAFNLQIWRVASKHGKYLQAESGPKREKWDFKQPWWDDQELGKILCWWHHPRQYKASEYTHTHAFFSGSLRFQSTPVWSWNLHWMSLEGWFYTWIWCLPRAPVLERSRIVLPWQVLLFHRIIHWTPKMTYFEAQYQASLL